ncbi:MAG: VWA domain-containing protein [Leptospiraceae bacterium]|nr:VWA domain-containing protein [Leptospiraceae bacterium]
MMKSLLIYFTILILSSALGILNAQVSKMKFVPPDSDSDNLPDFLEIALGFDPNENECKPKKCNQIFGLSQQDYLVILLDQSQSMSDPFEEEIKTKMELAKKTIQDYLFQTPDYVKVGIYTFGRNGCSPLDVVKSPFQFLSKKQILEELNKIEPSGSTPIAGSLSSLREQLISRKGRYQVVLVTDGIESCDGDPISSAKNLLELNDIQLGINLLIVGVGVNAKEERELILFAKAVNSNYISVHSEKEFSKIFKAPFEEMIESYKTMICLQAEVDWITLCEKQKLDKARLFVNKTTSSQYQSLKQEEKKFLTESFAKIENAINSKVELYHTLKREGTARLQTRINELTNFLKK